MKLLAIVKVSQLGEILGRLEAVARNRTPAWGPMFYDCLLTVQSLQATDCSFLYFNRQLLDAGLKDLLERPYEARKLPTFMSAFLDGHALLQHTSMDCKATHKVDYPCSISAVDFQVAKTF